MDLVKPILSIAAKIHSLAGKVKANKKRCLTVSQRVKALMPLVEAIQERGPGKISAVEEKGLKEFQITLESARKVIEKYTEANLLNRILKCGKHGGEFNSLNNRLDDAFQALSGAMQVEQGNVQSKVFDMTTKLFEEATRKRQDEVDGMEDDNELKTMLQDHMKELQEMVTQFEQVKINFEKVLENLNKPSATAEAIRMIKLEELKFDHPKEPFMTTPTSEVYKGEYHGFTVAIKRYIGPVNTSPKEVRTVFNKEVETMRRFESPNILRMFGICVKDEEGPNPQFLIIMEYCEKGSLRDVLESKCNLPWPRKARMCLDAAQGLYRLHQTEVKSKVHGCLNSCKFLVADGYRVKLGGFELAKTETSLKRSANVKDVMSLRYTSPEALGSVNQGYSKECEMYSFGIVLWEILTREKPFKDLTDEEIRQKVCKEQFKEPLPEGCPEPLGPLGQLINDCRAYDAFQRPSAGVLLDKLRSVVAQLED